MNTKIIKTTILLTLIILLIGITSATTESDNTTTKIMKEKSETQKTEVQKSSNKIVKEKTISKYENNTKNIKEESQKVTVNDFDQLQSYLTSDKNDTLYLNIVNNIRLTDNIQINKAIKTLTITSPFVEINGNNKYQFLRITENNNVFINNTVITNCKGEYGGAIYNEGSLLINNSILSNNTATYGGNIYNNGELTIIMSKLNNNSNVKYGGAIYNNAMTSIINSNLNNNKVTEDGGAIYNRYGELKLTMNILKNNYAKEGGAIKNYHGNNVTIINNRFINNTASNASAISSGYYKDGQYYGNNIIIDENFFILNNATKTPSPSAIQSTGENIFIEFNDMMQPSNFNSVNIIAENAKITNNTFTDSNVVIKLNPVNSKIGEKILLMAEVIDGYENIKINNGNLVFKLNGKTLRSDGRFDSKASAMKLPVKNGVVTHEIVADLYLRNAKNLTASYSGTYKYDEVTSSSIEAQILKRNPQVNVTVSPLMTKHYDTLTITTRVQDITTNSTNNTIITDNTRIMIKVNGRTLKDAKGNVLYVSIDKNSLATYKYTIPAGMGAITANKTTRNYSVTAVFVGDNYYPNVRDSTYFHVVRSTTRVEISKVTVNKDNVLSIKATLKDFKGNNLIGSNKVIVKINGKSYKYNDGRSAYWLVQNGVVSISGIIVDPKTTIKRVQLVTGERQAYLEGRSETTRIIRV